MPFATPLLGLNLQLREDAGDGTIGESFPMHSDDGFDHPFLALMVNDRTVKSLFAQKERCEFDADFFLGPVKGCQSGLRPGARQFWRTKFRKRFASKNAFLAHIFGGGRLC